MSKYRYIIREKDGFKLVFGPLPERKRMGFYFDGAAGWSPLAYAVSEDAEEQLVKYFEGALRIPETKEEE